MPTMRDLLTKRPAGDKQKGAPFSQEEQDLRDLLNVQNNDMTLSNLVSGLPVNVPAHAPLFRQQPVVYGKRLADKLETFFRIAPELRGRVTALMSGPMEPAAKRLAASGFDASEFADTNLLGITGVSGPYKGRIALNPRRNYAPMTEAQVLAHELTHAAGYDEGYTDYAEDKYRQMKGLPRIKEGDVGALDIPKKEVIEQGIAQRKRKGR